MTLVLQLRRCEFCPKWDGDTRDCYRRIRRSLDALHGQLGAVRSLLRARAADCREQDRRLLLPNVISRREVSMASVNAATSEWHCRLDLAPGNNEIMASGSWVFDPGRSPIGPGGNGTVAADGGSDGVMRRPNFKLANGIAGEGCLLARQSGGGISYFTSNAPINLVGPGYVEFVMNDNNYSDNSGSMNITITAKPR